MASFTFTVIALAAVASIATWLMALGLIAGRPHATRRYALAGGGALLLLISAGLAAAFLPALWRLSFDMHLAIDELVPPVQPMAQQTGTVDSGGVSESRLHTTSGKSYAF